MKNLTPMIINDIKIYVELAIISGVTFITSPIWFPIMIIYSFIKT
jgi:hypothetical protein